MKRMTIRLDGDLYQAIKERALREHRSVHSEVLEVLELFFMRGGKEEKNGSESTFSSGDPI